MDVMARVNSTKESREKMPKHEFEVEREVLSLKDGSMVKQATSGEKPAKKGKAYVEEDESGITFGVHR